MSSALLKPKVGEPCNGCGICCRITICIHGTYWLGLGKFGERAAGPCPASTLQDSRFQCGLVLFPKKYINLPFEASKLREAVKILVGAGRGCDSVGYFPTEEEEGKLHGLNGATKNDQVVMQKLRGAIKLLYNK